MLERIYGKHLWNQKNTLKKENNLNDEKLEIWTILSQFMKRDPPDTEQDKM